MKKLYAFGSVVSKKFSNESDIDLLIQFKDVSIEEYTENYFNLHQIFRNIFKRNVDLITDKSLRNPYLIKSIEDSKQLLYAD